MMGLPIGCGSDKVRVEVNRIENGYLISRSWCEVEKRSGGGEDHHQKEEAYFLESLPPLLEKMFDKKSNGKEFGGKATPKKGEEDGKDTFDKATDKFLKSKGGKWPKED